MNYKPGEIKVAIYSTTVYRHGWLTIDTYVQYMDVEHVLFVHTEHKYGKVNLQLLYTWILKYSDSVFVKLR